MAVNYCGEKKKRCDMLPQQVERNIITVVRCLTMGIRSEKCVFR